MTMVNKSEHMVMNMKQEVRVSMGKRIVLFVLILGVLTTMPSGVIAAGMDMKTIAEKEVTMVDHDGKEYLEYFLTEMVEVVPGNIIRFTNVYRNLGREAAEPGLTINNPVPKEVAYIGGTATGKNAKITFSVDGGKSFGLPSELFVTGEDGKKRPARPDEYTDIKWVILKAVLPGEEGSVAYKGKLK